MSLFGSISLAANSLRANEIALQVVGQNIANANTPGYIREQVIFAPAPTQRMGRLLIGTGVQVDAIVQRIDQFLEGRLRNATSDRVDAETQESAFAQLEGVLGELSDSDLSTALSSFFNSISEVLNQPESMSIRNLAVLQGATLAYEINRLSGRVSEIRSDINERIIDMAGNINRLVSEIQTLNIQIATYEGGDVSASDAVGLRDQRLQALENLSKLIDIRVEEQESGGVVVYAGSSFLVFEGVAREVEVVLDSDRGLTIADIHLKETDAPLNPAAGELAGLLTARDEIMGDFLDQLNDFTQTFIFEFNKIYSRGQGLNGFSQLISEFTVDGSNLALNNAGLTFTPTSGTFEVLVRDEQTGQVQTYDITIDLNGIAPESTLASLVADLNAISGISSTALPSGELSITSDSTNIEFSFGNDTSGVLAALGLNTFFTGSSAANVGVSTELRNDPGKFAASLGGIAADTDNAVNLAAFLDMAIPSQNNASLAVLYDRMVGRMTQSAAITRAVASGSRVFEDTLRGQKMAISGVSLDEEAVKMMAYQRSFQASARYIGVLSELFGILVAL